MRKTRMLTATKLNERLQCYILIKLQLHKYQELQLTDVSKAVYNIKLLMYVCMLQ